MDDYISRAAATDVLCDACGNAACPKGMIPRCSYYDKMQAIPPADVRSVVRGKFEFVKKLADGRVWKCSNCNLYYMGNTLPEINFCPNCGADMREANNEP